MDRWKTAAAISENVSDRCVPQTQYESWLGPSALHVRIWCEVCLIFGSGRGSSSFSKKNMSNINTLLSQFSLLYRCILWTWLDKDLCDSKWYLWRFTLPSSKSYCSLRSQAHKYSAGWQHDVKNYRLWPIKVLWWKAKPSYYHKYGWHIVSWQNLLSSPFCFI